MWDLIRQTSAHQPDAVALTDGTRRFTYAELIAAAARAARLLRDAGIRPGDTVALCSARSADQVPALVGILAAGAAVAPFDVRQAAAAVRENVARLAPAAVLADAEGAALFPDALRLDGLSSADRGPDPAEPPGPGPEDLAYVLHTSGSSGRPKPVQVPHSAVQNRFLWGQSRYPIGPDDTVVHWGSLVFDCSFWVVLAPLCFGATLLVAPEGAEADPRELAALMDRHRVTVMHSVPSLLREFTAEGGAGALASLRYLLIAGERLPGDLIRRVLELTGARIFNQYGPTETCIDVLTHEIGPGDEALDAMPIGRPLDGVHAVIADETGVPVPVGTPGELLMGGACVAWGYAGAAAATAERFVPDPYGSPGGRLYRTGDLVRERPDGALEFLGRVDHQVKIRGVRVEPSDVEHALLLHPEVDQAAVVAVEDPRRGGVRLAAHLVTGERTPDDAALRRFLAQRLVSAAIPETYRRHRSLPRLTSGKIDRLELARQAAQDPPAPDGEPPYQAPRTETERAVARIWQDLLRVERVGRDSDFLSLGGQSLLAMRMIARVRAGFRVRLSARTVFDAPTVARFAAVVDAAVTERDGAGVG
ncbi:non-ribosomal peptide synthetase [Streptomyces huiliensis]|uniref:non-ribosomal peptide synthetase n=1 Tax=Streptomyces huiliensis TaxID=2876027 RepID=UPI001CBF3598|nr:non-ribosomal peptide synthetase [Streptomyces huiliensis]MBZ4321267.1 non-ribosomal peptide synthetase [Streptomyces huiliensis]